VGHRDLASRVGMWGRKSTASTVWDVRGQRCCHRVWVKETGVLSEEYGFRGHLSFFPVRFGNGKGGGGGSARFGCEGRVV
jgi:hypothetical protein